MEPRASLTPNWNAGNRRSTIAVSVRLQCHAIPARWTINARGSLSYLPDSVGLIKIDPWKVRRTFLSLERNNEQLLTFLEEIGSWDLMPSRDVADYWEWQDIFRAVELSPMNWRKSVAAINQRKARRLAGFPNHRLILQSPSTELRKATLSCANHSVLDALIASLVVDEAKLLRRRPTVRHDKTNKTRKRRKLKSAV
jgi:hypothetical protein